MRRGRGTGRGPLPYKEFMRELPDDITPEDAQKEFQAYLTRWWGSKVRRGRRCRFHWGRPAGRIPCVVACAHRELNPNGTC